MAASPFFLPTADGQRFCVHHGAATTTPVAAVVYLHPFADEMNKSRRMAAVQARALAAAGCEVLQIDLHGCGDSSGDFGEATWGGWVDDGLRAVAWLRSRCGAPLWLWGLRTGGLLAADVAERLDAPTGLLLWNPTSSGALFLKQFLRLKVAAEAMRDRQPRSPAAPPEPDGPAEVAGYTISAGMAAGLGNAALQCRVPLTRLCWLETATTPGSELSPAAQSVVERWRPVCGSVAAHRVAGPAFWMTAEIEEAPSLIEATTAAVLETG